MTPASQADQGDPDRVALLSGFSGHQGAQRPQRLHDVHLAAVTGTPPSGFCRRRGGHAGHRGAAQVEVEPGPVGGQPGDVGHLDRQGPAGTCRPSASWRPGWRPAARAGRCRWPAAARPTWSRPAVALVRLAMAEIAVPIGCRSAARPETSCWSVVTRLPSALPREVIVCSTELRLPITSSMTWSLVASDVVSEPTVATSAAMSGLSPWNTWMISLDSLLTSPGDSAWNSGWKPLNSSVRLSAGVVRASGIVPPGGSARPTGPGALAQLDVALADQVQVLDRRRRRGGQLAALLQGEADQGEVAVVDADRGHVADPDPGDVHVIAHDQPGDVGEHRLVADVARGAGVGDADAEHRGDRDGDDHEDDDLTSGPARLRRFMAWPCACAWPCAGGWCRR